MCLHSEGPGVDSLITDQNSAMNAGFAINSRSRYGMINVRLVFWGHSPADFVKRVNSKAVKCVNSKAVKRVNSKAVRREKGIRGWI